MKLLLALLAVIVSSSPAEALDLETEARLKMAYQIAREHNDAALVKEVERAGGLLQNESDAGVI